VLKGSIVALITPMTAEGAVDWGALERLVEWHLTEGTHGIVPVGTTGESSTLEVREHLEVIRRTVELVAGKVPVVAGTGANATAEAIHLTQEAARLGADACLVVTPYYNRPTQEGLFRHFKAIAEASGVPLVLYNVPPRTACDMLPETVARLATIENIIAIKEACGDPERVTQIKERVPDDFIVLSGEDAQTLRMMELGALGTISVTANVLPNMMSRFCQTFLDGDVAASRDLDGQMQPVHKVLFIESSPQPTKWALYKMGRVDRGIRLPLIELSEEHREELLSCLKKAGAL